jgi:hypothetical protein
MITIHSSIQQGTDEWLALRCGVLTSSVKKQIITPTLKVADNDKSRAIVYKIADERIHGYIENGYESEDMIRGTIEEIRAKEYYKNNYAPVTEVGFITNTSYGYTWGYSPDGLVGDDGLIEIKSSKGHIHVKRICDGGVPDEHIIQIQDALLISGRKWCDYIDFSNGRKMMVVRVYPDPIIQEAIIKASMAFEVKVAEVIERYHLNSVDYIDTERVADVTDEIQIED